MSRDWWLISDIDGTLTGDGPALEQLSGLLKAGAGTIGFGVATGRSPQLTKEAVEQFGLPEPQVAICSVGTELSGALLPAHSWPTAEQRASWNRNRVLQILSGQPGLQLQPAEGQGEWKVSFHATEETAAAAETALLAEGLNLNVIHSAGRFLDILPAGVSKGSAVRFLAGQLGLPLSHLIVAGDSGNDSDMLTSGARAIVVANHGPELAPLRNDERVYFAKRPHAGGILEGLEHYGVPL